MTMRRIWETTIINCITVFTILAMIAGFSMVSGYLNTTISARDRQGELIEVVHHFLDKATEPALFTKSDETRFPDLKMNFLRNFTFSEPASNESNFYFSHFGANFKNGSSNFNLPVTIKLLI